MKGPVSKARYRSYLVRCWSDNQEHGGAAVWRFSITAVGGSARGILFASLRDLVGFMQHDLQAGDNGSGPDGGPTAE
jgi:hypothetical protein